MDVSIIIPTRNTCAMTRTAIQSVLAANDSLSKEILVVDNGSTDETAAVLPKEFPAVRFLRSETNLGFARGCNRAGRESAGKYLLLLNSDARPAAQALEKAVRFMEANPDCAVAGGQLLNADGSRQNSIANFPTLATELLNKSLLRRLWPARFPGKEQRFAGPVDVESIVGAFFCVRKTAWDELGGLDERYFFFLEETDFCLRVRWSRRRVVHLPDVAVAHGQGATAKQMSAAARIEYWRSRYRYFRKNFGRSTCAVLAIGLLLRLWVDWTAAALVAVLTLGQSARWRSRFAVCSALLAWHLRLCPADAGLPRA